MLLWLLGLIPTSKKNDMNTEKILIFGLGVLGGYLLFKYSSQPAGASVYTPVANTSKEMDCLQKWNQTASAIKAPENVIARMKADFMASCLSGKTEESMPAPVDMPPPQIDLSQI